MTDPQAQATTIYRRALERIAEEASHDGAGFLDTIHHIAQTALNAGVRVLPEAGRGLYRGPYISAPGHLDKDFVLVARRYVSDGAGGTMEGFGQAVDGLRAPTGEWIEFGDGTCPYCYWQAFTVSAFQDHVLRSCPKRPAPASPAPLQGNPLLLRTLQETRDLAVCDAESGQLTTFWRERIIALCDLMADTEAGTSPPPEKKP